jgi:hypothetical protein
MSGGRIRFVARRGSSASGFNARVLAGGVGLALALGLILDPVPASSQQGDAAWGEPVNISRTGGTDNPHLAVTASGQRHVVWDVTFADSGYSFGDGAQWSRPTSLEVPFVGRPVTLVPSRGGDVHAFWLDDEGSLFYNMVPANSLSSTASWFGGRRLASSVAAFAVAVDDQNRPHLGIIRAEDTPSLPSGVYYMVSPSGGQFWSPPHLLYESNYYQSYLPTSGPADPAGATLDGPAVHVAAETA